MAGNQLGKTMAGGAEGAIHLTGRYPTWWKGRRWDRPTVAWAAGVTGESTRDNVQRWLMGRPGEFGTGMIPEECIKDPTPARGVADLLDYVRVKHVSGLDSIVYFKSYEKGRAKWQGESLDWLWFDEEPDEEIYAEGLTRTSATGGMVWVTFTPLQGMSLVVLRFMNEYSPDRVLIVMTIDDVAHYSDEQKRKVIEGYLPHEREARARGIPIMGSGLVFPIPEEEIVCAPFEIPAHFVQLGALDFGWDHPFAAVRLAWDREVDRMHVTHCYRSRETTPLIQCAALKPWGEWLPWAWPHDGTQHGKGDGEQLAPQYKAQGLQMHAKHATFESGGFAVEPGILDMYQRMQTGKFKVFSTQSEWLEEYRMYHRKDGEIVKLKDDLMSATRIGIMMRRIGRQPPVGGVRRTRTFQAIMD